MGLKIVTKRGIDRVFLSHPSQSKMGNIENRIESFLHYHFCTKYTQLEKSMLVINSQRDDLLDLFLDQISAM